MNISRDLRITNLQDFSGTKSEDAAQWVRIFERHASRQEWTDAETLSEAVSYFRSDAERWYTHELEKHGPENLTTWTALRELFTKKYIKVDTPMEQLKTLLNVKKSKDETLTEYVTRVQDLARRLGSLATPETVLVSFKNGLEARYLLEVEEKEPKTLDEAISIVEKKERLEKLKAQILVHKEPEVSKDDRLNNARKLARENNACYTCYEVGHTAANCPNKKAKRQADLRRIDKKGPKKSEGGPKHDMKSYVEIEVNQEELLEFLDMDCSGEIRIISKRPLVEDDHNQDPKAKRMKLRIPLGLLKKKHELEDQKKKKNADMGDTMTPRPYNVEQKISTMNSGMTLAQAIEECPRVRSALKQACESKEARTIASEPTSTPVTSVRIGDENFSVLIDGGASVNIMSKAMAKQLGLKAEEDGKLTRLTLGDGRKIFTSEIIRDVMLKFGNLTVPVDFLVLKMPDYQLLLGRGFLKKVEATTDWKSTTFKFQYGGIVHEFIEDGVKNPALKLNLIENSVEYDDQELRVIEEEHQGQSVENLLESYADVFGPLPKEVHINTAHALTVNSGPIKQRPYRVSPKEDEFIKTEVDRLLELNIIRPSKSPWASPVVLADKKDGTLRFCVNYQRLNDVTLKDSYPQPIIEDLLNEIAGHKYYSKLDLYSGYHQIPMNEKSVEYTAFVVKQGLYEFVRMPFGLTNAPASFQRTMDDLFSDLYGKFVTIYMDDFCIYSNSLEEHLEHLRIVMERLRKAGLRAKKSKCMFLADQIEYLGHQVNQDGIKIDPKRTEAISQIPEPSDVNALRRFLGMVGYLRSFIEGFSITARPLFELLKKDVKFEWGNDQRKAFNELKEKLLRAPVLTAGKPELPYILVTDASDYGIGGALLQLVDGKEKPVMYWSRSLNSAERNYSTTDKEALAVVSCLKKFRHYLWGLKFEIHTDHQALVHIFNNPDPRGRLARWVLTLREFDFIVKYRKGAENALADGLSRNESLRVVQRDFCDPCTLRIYDYLNTLEIPEELSYEDRIRLIKSSKGFFIHDGELYKKQRKRKPVRVVQSDKERQRLITQAHDGLGHFGIRTTYEFLSGEYYWPDLFKQVKEYISTCQACQAFSKANETDIAAGIGVKGIFERMGLDYVGPLPETKSGNKYLIVAIEYLTGWPIAKAVKSANASTTAKFIYHDIVCQFGVPKIIMTDRGTHFNNELVEQIAQLLSFKHSMSSAYNPQTNGKVERFNGTLSKQLGKMAYDYGGQWTKYVDQVLLAYRIRNNPETGKSPYELMYGVKPNMINWMTEDLEQEYDREHENVDDIRKAGIRDGHTTEPQFKLNEQVMIKEVNSKKFQPKWRMPYTIANIGPNNSYQVKTQTGYIIPQWINGRRLHNYHQRDSSAGGEMI